MTNPINICVTGGTGYMGQRLIPLLLARGHRVRVVARESSASRVPAGAAPVIGDALKAESVAGALQPDDTLIHLVGTPHPNPTKATEFQQVDLASIRATVIAAKRIAISHLVYVSIAQPAPFMRAYLAVRAMGEAIINQTGLTATILRPWYVLGPGHWWPIALTPLYKIAELFPSTRASAQRLGLVTIDQMVNALVEGVENPPPKGQVRVVEVPAIRLAGNNSRRTGATPEHPL
jgi:uncharacterized protein YbjT (DUF2867 family)